MTTSFERNGGGWLVLALGWVLAAGCACAQTAAPKTVAEPAFDAATIKPAAPSPDGHTHINYPDGGRWSAINITLLNLMQWAYDMPQKQILDGPAWMDSTRFDIQATTGAETDAMLRALPSDRERDVKRSMVQRLLEERLGLKLHRETRVLAAYDLVVAKGGAKLTESKAIGKSFGGGRGNFHAEGLTVELIAEEFSRIVGRVVVDKTGLSGRYDLKLQWTPDDAIATADSPPSLFTAIEEQLGVQLKAAKEPVPILVVDRIELPSPN